MPHAPHSLSKLAAPAGAIAALAVAVGVWLLPAGALDPKPPMPPKPKPIPGQTVKPFAPAEPPVIDWTALAQNLNLLRVPDPVVADTQSSGDLITPDQPDEPPPPPPPSALASWQYEGYVREADRYIALVRMSGAQRFVFPDQEITDPSIPGQGVATIKSIDPDRLIVVVDGREFEVKRVEPVETNDLMRDPLQQAGRLE